MANDNQSWWEWLNFWMSQNAADWQPISWAMDNNPILIGIHIIAGAVLAITFLSLSFGFMYQSYRAGFMNKEQRLVVIFFTSFLFMCGAIFVCREFMIFVPFYWVYGAVKSVASVFALLTLITYIRIFPSLKEYPTARDFLKTREENKNLKRRINLLNNHLAAWTDDVGYHIQLLKGQQRALADDLANRGLPVVKLEDIHKSSEPLSKGEALASLERIKKDLDDLMENINERETTK